MRLDAELLSYLADTRQVTVWIFYVPALVFITLSYVKIIMQKS